MEPFVKIDGVAAPLDRVNVDTDAIIPAIHLKSIRRTGYGQFLFGRWRFNEDGSTRPDFVLNQPSYANASILIAGNNFGCGSSREHAPWALGEYGIRWLEEQRFDRPVQRVVFQEYVDAGIQAQARVAALESQMREVLDTWSLRPMVEALMSLRGVAMITAMTVVAERGDLTRFDSPRQLMSFVGLTPSEYSSGSSRRRGAITKTGNGHVLRVVTESAWAYRFPARKTAHLRRKARAAGAAPGVQAGMPAGGRSRRRRPVASPRAARAH